MIQPSCSYKNQAEARRLVSLTDLRATGSSTCMILYNAFSDWFLAATCPWDKASYPPPVCRIPPVGNLLSELAFFSV